MLMTACAWPSCRSQPNILLILADDLGWDDLGNHGNSIIETPNLDRLAGESVQFSQYYVTPVCATTRASLLTGRHFLRTGVSHVHGGKDYLHLDETTLAEALKKAGYATGMWGKWHSGRTTGYFPWERGFDEAFMARFYDYYDNEGMLNGEPHKTEGWVTGVLANMVIDFMKKNREVPFFAYLSLLTCHAPLDVPQEYIEKYRKKGLSQNLSTLYGMVDHMDYHIGRLLVSLEQMGITENTLVLFMSDNGPAVINRWLTDEDRKTRYVNGMRGHKGDIWENGIRSLLFVRYEGRFPPGTVHRLCDVTDIFPTLIELAGASVDIQGLKLDGRSILPYLQGNFSGHPDKEVFLYANPGWPPTDRPWTPEGVKDEYRPWKYSEGNQLAYPGQIMGIRTEDYKLLYNTVSAAGSLLVDKSGYALFDIRKDLKEHRNILAEEAEIGAEMRRMLGDWHTSVFHDSHAFESPVFKISRGSTPSEILACAPWKISMNVNNAALYITHFTKPDDFAKYKVNVLVNGSYDIRIYYAMEEPDPLDFIYNLAGNKTQITLQPGEKSILVENVLLEAGLDEFEIKCTENARENDLKLYKFTFAHTRDQSE